MPKIRIDLHAPVINGQTLTFQSPADCSAITGLVIYYPEGESKISKEFQFVDSHGVDVGSGTFSLFAENALVRIILDTDNNRAFVQNADTNAYLEDELGKKYSPDNKPKPEDIGAAAKNHGNHVPTTQTADNATFLRNDNTWQKVTPENIGASATGHKHTMSEITDLKTETWTFTLEDGSTVTKAVYVG